MSDDVTTPDFVGDYPQATDLPRLPAGHGAILCRYSFDSKVDVERPGRPTYTEFNHGIWVPPPVVHIDGREVRASWSGWWYPLPSGPHQIEVREPVAATLRVEVTPGATHWLRYRVDLSILQLYLNGPILKWRGKATLRETPD